MIKTKNQLYVFILLACVLGFGWLFYVKNNNSTLSVCLVKKITNIPCPSCGTTRSVEAIINGKLYQALLYNPFGYIVFFIMIIAPIWIIKDGLCNSDSFHSFYKKLEERIQNKKTAIVLITLVIINWIWNIYKNN